MRRGQGVRQPKTRMKPELRKVRSELRVLSCNAMIGDEREAKTCAHSRTLHSRHNRLLRGEEPHSLVVQRARRVRDITANEIGPRTEILARAGQQHDANITLLVHRLERIRERGHVADADVIVRRVVELNDRNVAIDFCRNFAHQRRPIRLRATTMR